MTKILLTNDDGIYAEGIQFLENLLSNNSDIDLWVIAPATNQSNKGTGVTNSPQEIKFYEISDKKYIVEGTSSDCVFIGINVIMENSKPDITISGLAVDYPGHTGNLSIASGTVSAGITSAILDVPAIAITHETEKINDYTKDSVEKSIDYAIHLINEHHLTNTVLNINIPKDPTKTENEIKFTASGHHNQFPLFLENKGNNKYVYNFNEDLLKEGDGSVRSLNEGYITITPLTTDNTDYAVLDLILKSDYIS